MNFGIFVLSEILFAVALLGFNLVTARADWESTLAAAKKDSAETPPRTIVEREWAVG